MKRVRAALPHFVNVALTMLFVSVGWVFFRAPNMRTAWHILTAMCGRQATDVETTFFLRGALLPNQSIFVLSFALLLLAAPVLFGEDRVRSLGVRVRPFALALVPFALALSIAQLVNGGFTPLIYFKF